MITTKMFSRAIGNISEKYIDEAATYTAKEKNSTVQMILHTANKLFFIIKSCFTNSSQRSIFHENIALFHSDFKEIVKNRVFFPV